MSKKTPKPKKKHKGLIIFLVIFSILVVFPVGFIFGAFYTTDTKKVSNSEITYQNIVSKAFYNGVKGLSEENPKLNLTIDEDMFDGILMGACEKIGQPQYIPKMYCYIKDNNYTFVVDLQASFFKSRIQIHTTLSKDEKKNELVFKITGITLGRLPIPLNWITSILGNFINDEMLNNAFSQSGFHIQSHLSETKLTYSREQFKEDVGGYVEKLGEGNPFLQLLLPMLGDEEHNILSTGYDNGITVSFDLQQLELPEAAKPAPLYFTELDKHQGKIVEWLNKGYLLEKDVSDMFVYLIRGSEHLGESSAVTFINSIKNGDYKGKDVAAFESEIKKYVGTDDVTNYSSGSKIKAVTVDDPIDFNAYCGNEGIKAEFDITKLPNEVTFTVTTESLNKYLALTMTDAIGRTIPITYKNVDDTWGFEFALVDNLYINFDDDGSNNPKMIMYLTINLSGVRLGITLETDSIKIDNPTTDSFGKLSFTLKDAVHFGSILINDKNFLNPVLELIPFTGDVFTYNNGYFAIDIDAIIAQTFTHDQETQILALLKNATVKSSATDAGLSLTYSNS